MGTQDTSTLAVQVQTTGATETYNSLDQVSTQAGKTEASVTSLTSQISSLSDVFKSSLASVQAYVSSVTSLGSAIDGKTTSVIANINRQVEAATTGASAQADAEAAQWAKMTQQFDAFQSDRVSKVQSQLEKIDVLNNSSRDKEYASAQAEANRMNALYDSNSKSHQKVIEMQDTWLDSERDRQSAKVKADQDKQTALNNAFYSKSLEGQKSVMESAVLFASQGGDAVKKFGSSAVSTAAQGGIKDIETQLKEGEKSAHAFSLANAGVTRELVIMGHEAATGNFSRLGGSLTVLANRSGILQAALASIGVGGLVAIAGIAAGFIALTAAIVSSIDEVSDFNKAMVNTGNYVGVTRDQIVGMSSVIATDVTGGVSKATDMLTAMAATGKFTADQLADVSQAGLNFAVISGKSATEVATDFAAMKTDVTAFATNWMESHHQMDSALLEHITEMQKAGDVTGAMNLLIQNMNSTMKVSSADLSVWGSMWASVVVPISNAYTYLKGIVGLTGSSLNQLATNAKTAKAALDAAVPNSDSYKSALEIYNQNNAAYQTALNKTQQIQKDSETAQLNDRATFAQKAYNQLMDTVKTRQDTRDKDLATLAAFQTAEMDKKKAGLANDLLTETQFQEDVQKIRDKYKDKAGAKDDPTATILQGQLGSLQSNFKLQEDAYNVHIKMIEDLQKKEGADAQDSHDQKAAIYGQELTAVQENLNARLAIVDKFETAGKVQRATQQVARQDAVDDANKYSQAIRNAMDVNDQGLIDTQTAAYEKMDNAISSQGENEVKVLQTTLAAQQLKTLEVGKTAAEKEVEKLITDQLALSQDKADAAAIRAYLETGILQGNEKAMYEKLLANLNAQIPLREKITSEVAKQTNAELALQKTQNTTKMWTEAVKGAQDLGKALTDVFGQQGTAIGSMITSITTLGKAMNDLNVQQTAANKDISAQWDAKIAQTDDYYDKILYNSQKQAALDKSNADFANQSTTAQVKGYADMVTGLQGYFDAGSKGYNALGVISKAFHLAEIALEGEQLAVKLYSLAFGTAADAAATDASIANSALRATADGIAAFAKTLASLPFPFNLAAGAVVIASLAAVGVKIAGGGSSGSVDTTSAASVQKTQGTGTVLGDNSKQSDSINQNITLLATNSSAMLPLTSQMATSLKNMELGITGVATLISGQSAAIASGTNLGITVGKSRTGILGDIFGSSSTTIADAGLQFGGSVSNLQKGNGVQQYATENTDTKGAFGGIFGGDSNTSTDVTANTTTVVQQQFALIFQNLQSTLETAATALGKNASDVGAAVDSYQLDLTKISLQGLTGQQQINAINAVISAAMDTITTQVIPGMQAFTQEGEGYSETVVRVATGIEAASAGLQQLGIAAINYTDILNKQGDVATEIERQSIENAEVASTSITKTSDLVQALFGDTVVKTLTGVGDIIAQFSGSATDLIAAYNQLILIRQQMNGTGMNGGNLSQSEVSGAGSISALATDMQNYTTKFFTSQQQVAIETTSLTAKLNALGITTIPKTDAAFVALVNSIGTATPDAQKLTGEVLNLADAFNTVQSDAATAAADMVKAAQATTNTAMTDLTNAVNAQKTAITNAYNTQTTAASTAAQAIQDAATAQEAAYQSQLTAAQNTLTAIQSVFSALTGALGSVTVQTDALTAAQRAQANTTLRNDLGAANGGTSLAGNTDISGALTASALPSEQLYKSLSDYQKAQNTTAALISQLNDAAGKQVTTAQATVDGLTNLIAATKDAASQAATEATATQAKLDAQNKATLAYYDSIITNAQTQIDALNGINDGVLGVSTALDNLALALNAQKGVQATANAISPSTAGTSANPTALSSASTSGLAVSNMLNSWFSAIPARAMGGHTPTGMTLVGEQGPELVDFTQASNIYTAQQTAAMMTQPTGMSGTVDTNRQNTQAANTSNEDVVAEIKSLNVSLLDVKQAIISGDVGNAQATTSMYKIIRKWDGDGQPPVRNYTGGG